MHRFNKLLAIAGSALAVMGGLLAFSAPANAATLSVTLTASGTGSSAVTDSVGNPILTVGSSTGSFAEMTVDSPPTAAPTTAPTFATNNYASGSPRWFIKFAGGDSIFGYPAQANNGSALWTAIVPATGTCANSSAPTNASYSVALAFIAGAGTCGGNVSGAGIIADTGQAAGTSDTITNISYNGATLAGDVVTVTSPGDQTSTLGTKISSLQIKAASNRGNAITSWAATGLPTGLAIDANAGTITGTPTATGVFKVTVTATDNGGTPGTATFNWTINTSGPVVNFSGPLKLIKMGLCLDDRGNSSTSGAVVQVWRCNGLTNQVWQVMSDGTIRHNNLCLDAKGRGTTNGTKLDLWSCNGGANQKWDTRGWRIHYDNPAASNKVVDDTGFGGSGTQQEIYTNNGGANQIWGTV
ncbi:MAG TPA: ricin-type beta-trefoil lectin domain protein [Streptosporangiaceae bacterium]